MFVVDTNVLSELMKVDAAVPVVAWARLHDGPDLFTTSITAAEIGYGIDRMPLGRRRDDLRGAFDAVMREFGDRVLAFDLSAARFYGEVVIRRETAGRPIAALDAQIAAISRATNATLVTRNTKDFEGTGVALVDPWMFR